MPLPLLPSSFLVTVQTYCSSLAPVNGLSNSMIRGGGGIRVHRSSKKSISITVNCPEHEHMNMPPSPKIFEFDTPLTPVIFFQH